MTAPSKNVANAEGCFDTDPASQLPTLHEDGGRSLDHRGVLLVDGLGSVAPAQFLSLLDVRENQGFQIVVIGDLDEPLSVNGRMILKTLCRALGKGADPKWFEDSMQLRPGERQVEADDDLEQTGFAVRAKFRNGTMRLLPGNDDQVLAEALKLWWERTSINRARPGFTVSVAVPSADAAVRFAQGVRAYRRALREIAPEDALTIPAVYPDGYSYDMPLAIGDRVRLFKRTNASYQDRSRGHIGGDGSVLVVTGATADSVQLRNIHGREGSVRLQTLYDSDRGGHLLAYGDILTSSDHGQNLSTEHIEILLNGSRDIGSRPILNPRLPQREITWVEISRAAECRSIRQAHPASAHDGADIPDSDLIANVIANLSHIGRRNTPSAFIKAILSARSRAREVLLASQQRIEQREIDRQPPISLRTAMHRARGRGLLRKALLSLWRDADGTTTMPTVMCDADEISLQTAAVITKAMDELLTTHAGRIAILKRRVAVRRMVAAARERLGQGGMAAWKPMYVRVDPGTIVIDEAHIETDGSTDSNGLPQRFVRITRENDDLLRLNIRDERLVEPIGSALTDLIRPLGKLARERKVYVENEKELYLRVDHPFASGSIDPYHDLRDDMIAAKIRTKTNCNPMTSRDGRSYFVIPIWSLIDTLRNFNAFAAQSWIDRLTLIVSRRQRDIDRFASRQFDGLDLLQTRESTQMRNPRYGKGNEKGGVEI